MELVWEKFIDFVKYSYLWKLVKKIYEFLTKELYLTAYVYNFLFCVKHREYKFLKVKIEALNDYSKLNNLRKQVISTGNNARVYFRKFWNETLDKEYEEYPELEVFVSEMSDVSVFGETDYILKGQRLIIPKYNKETSDSFYWNNMTLKWQSKDKALIRYIDNYKYIAEGISYVGGASCNFFHFICEVLPKIVLCNEYDEYTDLPIIIDSGVRDIKPLKEALEFVVGNYREIIWLDKNTEIKVGRLIFVSPITSCPMNTKKNIFPDNKYMVMHEGALRKMREAIVSKVSGKGVDKIYIARYKTRNKRLQNDEEIAAICRDAGFEIIYPEELSFYEQVAYFKDARYVFACAGAGCTNIGFCSEQTKAFLFVPREHTTNLWPTYIGGLGVDAEFVSCRIVKKATYGSGDQYEADINEVKELLASIS